MTFPTSFPFSFPWGGDEFSPLLGHESIEGTSLEWIASHCDEAKALFIWQFRDKPRLAALVCALLDGIYGEGGVQELENVAWQCLTERWLDTGAGEQLNVIGRIVDLPRLGWTDDAYRLLLGARILVLSSDGTWPDLVGIMSALELAIAFAEIDEPGMASMRIILGEPLVGEITTDDVFRFLVAAKPAGVRFVLEFPPVAIDETFTWADGDDEQADEARGWADDADTLGGYWAGELATTETV